MSILDQAPNLQCIHSMVNRLHLDADITPSSAFVGPVSPDRRSDVAGFERFADQAGLIDAMATVLSIAPDDVGVRLVDHGTIAADRAVQSVATALHNEEPLTTSDVASLHLLAVDGGRSLVVSKLNHLICDAKDASQIFELQRTFLGSCKAAGPPNHYARHREALGAYLRRRRVPHDTLVEALGELWTPMRKGVPTVGRARYRYCAVRENLTFDEVLAEVAGVLAPLLGESLLVYYPHTAAAFRRSAGYQADVRPFVIRDASTAPGAPDRVRAARKAIEALGHCDMAEQRHLAARLAKLRMPRVVVSDTSFYRPSSSRWSWIPLEARTTIDDLKFLYDRREPSMLTVQFKERFLSHEDVDGLMAALGDRIGGT